MPRSLQEILDNAEELAKKFEDLDPDAQQVHDAGPLRQIQDAVKARALAEQALLEAVAGARDAGVPWALIGSYLGTSGEAARQRYQKAVATPATPAAVKAKALKELTRVRYAAKKTGGRVTVDPPAPRRPRSQAKAAADVPVTRKSK